MLATKGIIHSLILQIYNARDEMKNKDFSGGILCR